MFNCVRSINILGSKLLLGINSDFSLMGKIVKWVKCVRNVPLSRTSPRFTMLCHCLYVTGAQPRQGPLCLTFFFLILLPESPSCVSSLFQASILWVLTFSIGLGGHGRDSGPVCWTQVKAQGEDRVKEKENQKWQRNTRGCRERGAIEGHSKEQEQRWVSKTGSQSVGLHEFWVLALGTCWYLLLALKSLRSVVLRWFHVKGSGYSGHTRERDLYECFLRLLLCFLTEAIPFHLNKNLLQAQDWL